jgi:hypothetical protein
MNLAILSEVIILRVPHGPSVNQLVTNYTLTSYLTIKQVFMPGDLYSCQIINVMWFRNYIRPHSISYLASLKFGVTI